MKVLVLKSSVLDGMSSTGRVASGDTLPILKHVLIEAQNNKLVFTATNLEMAVQHSAPGKVIENGKVTVPARMFGEAISALQSERMNFEKKGDNLGITSDNYHATFQGLQAEDFPIIPKIKDTSLFIDCETSALKDALSSVLIATEFSDLRPELNSVLFHFTPQLIKLAATDSFRLAEQQIPNSRFTTNRKEEFKMLIPLKTAQELIKLVGLAENVRIYSDENQALFSAGPVDCVSRLIEGTFPEYSGVIPSSFQSEIVVGKTALLEALKLASVFNEKNNEVRFSFSKERKVVEISSADQGVGENAYLLSADIKGADGEVLFNGRYVNDVVRIARGEQLFIGISNESAPALFRFAGDSSYCYIAKPILKT